MEWLNHLENISLLLARLIMGGMFALSAKGKLKDIKSFAEKNGLPYPVGVLVVMTEGLSSIAFILGVVPRVAALAVMGLMCGTMYKHIIVWKSPYWASKGGWEYDLMWFTMAFIILTVGPGNIALYTIESF